jgi:hypothetical protein
MGPTRKEKAMTLTQHQFYYEAGTGHEGIPLVGEVPIYQFEWDELGQLRRVSTDALDVVWPVVAQIVKRGGRVAVWGTTAPMNGWRLDNGEAFCGRCAGPIAVETDSGEWQHLEAGVCWRPAPPDDAYSAPGTEQEDNCPG